MAKGATVDVPMHWVYLMGIWRNVPMSHDEKIKMYIFCHIANPKVIETSKSIDSWKDLENIFHLRRCRNF